jgi:hypothetical protein
MTGAHAAASSYERRGGSSPVVVGWPAALPTSICSASQISASIEAAGAAAATAAGD